VTGAEGVPEAAGAAWTPVSRSVASLSGTVHLQSSTDRYLLVHCSFPLDTHGRPLSP